VVYVCEGARCKRLLQEAEPVEAQQTSKCALCRHLYVCMYIYMCVRYSCLCVRACMEWEADMYKARAYAVFVVASHRFRPHSFYAVSRHGRLILENPLSCRWQAVISTNILWLSGKCIVDRRVFNELHYGSGGQQQVFGYRWDTLQAKCQSMTSSPLPPDFTLDCSKVCAAV
jgi:hypothetical protein